MVAYDDEAHRFPKVYKNNEMTCSEKIQWPTVSARSQEIAFGTPKCVKKGYFAESKDCTWTEKLYMSMSVSLVPLFALTLLFCGVFNNSRPRYFYFVLANCDKFTDVKYSIHATNMGSSWSQEFGVNIRGVWSLAFYLLFLKTLAVCFYAQA